MKKCGECNAIYEDVYDICPTCGDRLNLVESSGNGRTELSPSVNCVPVNSGDIVNRFHRNNVHIEPQVTDNRYNFERTELFSTVIDGAVAEINAQQFYQSKFTKFIRAIFAGEPYQLSHTSFVTIVRVEEHTQLGYPEQARDIIIYGYINSVLTIGDDVTVKAKKKGSRIIVKNVYNHSISSFVNIQSNIPAVAVRLLALLLLVLSFAVIQVIVSVNYASLGEKLITASTPVIIIGAIIWYIKHMFKK